MPEPTPRGTRAADLETRVTALEEGAEDDRRMLREVHAAIVGTTTAAGHGEQIRAMGARLDALERARNLATGVAVTAATAVASAWAAFAGGPRPPSPHP